MAHDLAYLLFEELTPELVNPVFYRRMSWCMDGRRHSTSDPVLMMALSRMPLEDTRVWLDRDLITEEIEFTVARLLHQAQMMTDAKRLPPPD